MKIYNAIYEIEVQIIQKNDTLAKLDAVDLLAKINSRLNGLCEATLYDVIIKGSYDIIEAKKNSEPDNLDDWVWFDHKDDECPLPYGIEHRVIMVNGGISPIQEDPKIWRWKKIGSDGDITKYAVSTCDIKKVWEWQKYNLMPKALPSGWIPLPEGLNRMPEWIKGVGMYVMWYITTNSHGAIWGKYKSDHPNNADNVIAILPLNIPAYEVQP